MIKQNSTEQGPAQKQLRNFAFVMSGLFLLVFGLIRYIFTDHFAMWTVYLSVVLCTTGLVYPKALSPLLKFWMKLGHVLEFINTRLILGFFFFIFFIPVGFYRRLRGIDPLSRKPNKQNLTYRDFRSDDKADIKMERTF